MDFQGIYDHLRAIGAPGLTGCDEPRQSAECSLSGGYRTGFME